MSASSQTTPVVIYDTCTIPILSEMTGRRVEYCRSFARRHGRQVLGVFVEEGKAVSYDGERDGTWVLLTDGRPVLMRAISLALESGAALLIAKRQSLSECKECVDLLVSRWLVPVLCASQPEITVTALPVRPGGHG